MSKKIYFLIILFQLFLFFKITAQVYSCPEVLDQSNTTENFSTSGSNLWQSFTANKSGYLTKVEFKTNGNSGGTTNYTYKIYNGQGINNTIIYEGSSSFTTESANLFAITMPINVVPVSSGSVYTCQIIIANGYNTLACNNADSYAGGHCYSVSD